MDKNYIITGCYSIFLCFLSMAAFLFCFVTIPESFNEQYESYKIIASNYQGWIMVCAFLVSWFMPVIINSYIGVEPKSVGIFPKRLRRLNYIISLLAIILIVAWGFFEMLDKIDNHNTEPATIGVALVLIILSLAIIGLTKSRLADINANPDLAWFVFLPYINVLLFLILFCMRGTAGENQYGKDPRRKGIPKISSDNDF